MSTSSEHRRAKAKPLNDPIINRVTAGRRHKGDAPITSRADLSGHAKSAFVDEIRAALREQNLSKSALADRLGKSRQYVTRVLSQSTNFTIESMAEIAAALGQELTIQVQPYPHNAPKGKASKRASS